MKTSIAAAIALALGFAGAAHAKLDVRLCSGNTAKHAQACEGTPYAAALIQARTTVCVFDFPETGDMSKFAATASGKFVYDSARKAFIELEHACQKAKKK